MYNSIVHGCFNEYQNKYKFVFPVLIYLFSFSLFHLVYVASRILTGVPGGGGGGGGGGEGGLPPPNN